MKKVYVLSLLIFSCLAFGQNITQSALTTANPVASPTILCEGETLTLTANPGDGVAPFTFAWSGPNGFTSSDENPVITNTTVNDSGVYSVIVTDANSVSSALESTENVTVNAKVDPFFEGLNPGLCRFGTPPILPNQSTNGVLGTWNPATVNNSIVGTFFYTFTPDAGQCANPFVQIIFVVNNVNPTFTLPASICINSTPPVLNNVSNNGIIGTWSPSTVSNTVGGTYTFTPIGGQCANVRTVTIAITPTITPTFTLPSYVCRNRTVPILPTTSNNGITGTWNPSVVDNTTLGNFTYVFTPTVPTQCGEPLTITISVNPNIAPTFIIPATICENDTAPILPATSNNGISGTWNPAIVSNTVSGTYLFTPDEGQCGTLRNVEITVLPKITPTFDPIPNVCYQSTPIPVLPNTSLEGIAGTWNPATISNTASGTYTFTPATGECALTTTLSVTVDIITPIFDVITPICVGETAPVLASPSNNGITGSWNPATISNTTSGTYTFTPDANQCATTATISVTVEPNITPTFDAIAPICVGETAPVLASPSNNGITGSWNPAIVDNTQTGTYVFTPDANQCALDVTITVTVNPNIVPTFDAIAPFCVGETAPVLATTSNEGITGTWNPTTIDNTQSGDYTFTPTAGECAVETTISVTVNPIVTPTFDTLPLVCLGGNVPVLPTTSNEGITGTWNPATISNTIPGSYTFTPTAGQCAIPVVIEITLNPNITPTFDTVPEICFQSTVPSLPTTSNNGITGSWNPATISNTASGSYTFTPDENQCALPVTISVTVNTIIPLFDAVPPICNGQTAPILPTTSNNGITGTWFPATVSNTQSGTYTFTPDANQCATTATISVTVTTITPTFDSIAPICLNGTVPILATTSNNGITGTWNPATISNTIGQEYTFTPDANQCAIEVVVTTTILTITPTFDISTTICENATAPILATTSNNGITGSWNPATVDNTQTGTYEFTPDANQCAINVTVTITVSPNVTPAFEQIADVCFQTANVPSLPTTSLNGITGTWFPATVSSTIGLTYTFTPTVGLCALQTIMTINIITITPTFDPIADVCFQTVNVPTLPTTSLNGITGTWNPAIVSSTIGQTYTFTPNAEQCAVTATLSIGLLTITPIFDPIADVCFQTANVPTLPTTSLNGITGTWNPAIVSSTIGQTYTFTPNAEQCATTATLSIGLLTITPTFDPIADVCFQTENVPTLPTTSLNGITGTWNPAIVSSTVGQTYTFTPNAEQCASITTLSININTITPTFDSLSPICENATPPVLQTTSNNGITGSWFPATINNTVSGSYTFTPDLEQCAAVVSINFVVNANVTPTFNPIADVCYNTTAPNLPLVSNEGITGTWNPAIIDNTQSGTYIFTPNPGECAVSTSITVNVTTINTTFTAIAPICENATAPLLPLVSNEGITGTWNPATVSNTTTGTYVFTPNPNQCATNASLEIVVVPNITPTFTQILDVCFQTVNVPTLPTISNEGITGTWNPAIVSSTTAQTYTFTPNVGECAFTTTMTIGINSVTTTFNQIANVCYGTAIVPTLPTISNEGITGTWNPSTVSNTIAQTYTFTPNAEQCATTASMTIGINVINTTFNAIPNVCYGSASIPTLPLISNEGITGTWSPSIISNTVSNTYTFTPDAEQCATVTTLPVIVDIVVPAFNFATTICQNGTAPILPTTSTNLITGTWNPAIVDNTTTADYIFTPDAEQCATSTTVTVTVGNNILPTFNFSTTYCENGTVETLPLSSIEGITGTWNPTTISNTTNGSYSFTPDANQCALSNTINVTIVTNVTPTFTQLAAFCSGTESPVLSTTSIEGFTGTWFPATVSNTSSGNYIFTPTAGQCATIASMNITVNQSPTDLEFETVNVFNETSNGEIEITAVISGLSPYTYSIDGSDFTATTIYQNLAPGDYDVTVRDANGCEYTETVTIDSSCMFPKGLSPNNDGRNDTFNLNDCNVVKLDIFNRYGTKVNSFGVYTSQWNGTTDDGKELPDGTYYYVAETDAGIIKTGWVYLTR